MPVLYREYKRRRVHPLQGANQARIYLTSESHYYAALEMYDVPVFALATVGGKGRLLCGWAEKVSPPNPKNPDDANKDPASIALSSCLAINDLCCYHRPSRYGIISLIPTARNGI